MKLWNETHVPIVANIDGRWYELPAGGEKVEVDDYVVASTLVEHGASANAVDLEAARQAWADQNRAINSRIASASQSEGAILGKRQATVDPQLGTVTRDQEPAPLAGAELKAAVEVANEAGANIDPKAKADDKRAALAEFRARQGASTPLSEDPEFVTDPASGELLVDSDGQPFRTSEVEVDDDGVPVLVEGLPVVKGSTDPDADGQGDARDAGGSDDTGGQLVEGETTPGTGGDPSAGTGGDGAGSDQGPTDPADPEEPADSPLGGPST